MKPVKLGIIGCGIAARELHWPALERLKNEFKITAVCNHTGPKAKSFAEMVGGVPCFLDYRELLASAEVEAVDIILPLHLNYEVTAAALKAGKHVIVEKPLAANIPQAKKMLELDSRYSRVKLLAENFRYRVLFNRAKQIIAVIWNIFHHVDAKYNPYARTEWRIHHRYPGGFVTDGGVHQIGAIRLLFGDIRSGRAVTKSVNPAIGEIDTMMFHFETVQGLSGELNFFYSAMGYSDETMHVLGNKGSLLVRNGEIILKQDGFKEQIEKIEDDGGFYGELKNFYEAIRRGKPLKSPFLEGYKDLKVILSAIKSARSGRKFVLRYPEQNEVC
jgi:predicted dehydrogenase